MKSVVLVALYEFVKQRHATYLYTL